MGTYIIGGAPSAYITPWGSSAGGRIPQNNTEK